VLKLLYNTASARGSGKELLRQKQCQTLHAKKEKKENQAQVRKKLLKSEYS